MAPTKTRATTVQQKLGFLDDDLKRPEHDEIMRWLDAETEELMKEYFKFTDAWDEKMIARGRAQADELVRTRYAGRTGWQGLGDAPPRSFIVEKKTWERPITNSNNYVVGFADLEVVLWYPRLLSVSCPGDYSRFPSWDCSDENQRVIFEVKTTIPSAGELIRQIRLYQQYLSGHYIVVSPDDRHADVLRSQGIDFLKYTGSGS